MNTANEQTPNLTNNSQNSNLTNSSSKKFARDYDKEPIVLKNYEEAYQILLKMIPFILGLVGAAALCADYDYTGSVDIAAGCMAILLLILFFVLISFMYYKKDKPTLKIKNGSIEFYEKGKRVFVSKRDDLRKFIYKPFFIGSEKPTDWLYWLAVAPIAIYVITLSSYVAYFALGFVVFNIVGNLLTKFFMCLVLSEGKGIKFSSFPIIRIDKPYHKPGSFWGVSYSSYYTITIVDKEAYKEVKGYFLSKHGINIDEIDKVYF